MHYERLATSHSALRQVPRMREEWRVNRIEQVFGTPRVLLPVIHPVSRVAALESIRVAHDAGVRGVFLIDQGMREDKVLDLVREVRDHFPGLWIGVNLLGRRPAEALEVALDACGISPPRPEGRWTPTRSRSRPERHFADSFATMRLAIARAIARWLPRCPACHAPRRSGPDEHPWRLTQ